MAENNHEGFSHSAGRLRIALANGANATTVTVTGIALKDKILSVYALTTAHDATYGFDVSAMGDYTSEFSISAANTITNAGGTNLTDKMLVILWEQGHPNS